MSQSLLDEKDLDFPNTQVTKTMQSRERSHTTPSASPDIGFPGGGVRQPFIFGSLAKLGTKAAKSLLADATKEVKAAQKNLPKGRQLKEFTKEIKQRNEDLKNLWDFEGGPEEFGEFGEPAVIPSMAENWARSSRDATLESIDDLEKLFSKNPQIAKEIKKLKTNIFRKVKDKEAAESLYEAQLFKISERFKSKAKGIATDAQLGFPEEGYSANAIDVEQILSDLGKVKKQAKKKMFLSSDDVIPFNTGGRVNYQEGSLMVPPEMEQDMPVDTYPNIPPEEMADAEASQLPDAEMEDNYISFVMEESLDDEEQSYLMNALEADPKLSQIFDKVISTASEFTGSGEVAGPGTGVSDSIPARLSDGEFVFTKKATDQMGADNLQQMMDDAERAHDGGLQTMRRSAQEGGLLMYKQKDEDPLAYEKIAQDEIKKNMLRSNRAPSLNPGQI